MHATGAQTHCMRETKEKKEKKKKKGSCQVAILTRATDERPAHLPAHPYLNLMTSCLFILYMYKGWIQPGHVCSFRRVCFSFFLLSSISMYKILSISFLYVSCFIYLAILFSWE
ncbi:hypothetical protein BDV32DRAFT_10231 [Aspergillus pseudonomiae]|uniref:Uncharacterized protein n=1 Tax=Aspergillus pseudonomiae TaxID=1506151 RepID=A0A5N7CZZ4_9EURO|nr:uncharacterized protein BDV37DRAFT_225432 [Aspergillus pseudonomiae]KAB8254766.1 hypothetical protein BDV32DRAFT_10231 [Aspergillus pseudonomiae]KAE8399736.1 hypothetical protein BDV37DRAFT_225432 [Aspergillus pseudonomiae]